MWKLENVYVNQDFYELSEEMFIGFKKIKHKKTLESHKDKLR